MAYWDQAELSKDTDFLYRLAACAAVEVDLGDVPATTWAMENQWAIAAAPGFADAYASAVVAGIANPGRDPAVISDLQILSAVQAQAATP